MTTEADLEETTAGLLTLLNARPKIVAPGEYLFREGETTGTMYRLEQGRLEVLKRSAEGRVFQVNVVGPGELVGEISMLVREPHTASLRALEKCVLVAVTQEGFERLTSGPGTPSEQLLRKMTKNLARTLERQDQVTLRALERELDLQKLRAATSTFLVHMLLGFAAYAVVMKWMADNTSPLLNATIVTGPLMLGMVLVAVSFARRSGFPRDIFGLRFDHAGRHALTATLLTLPVLAGLTALRWGLVQWHPGFAGERLIPLLHEPFAAGPAIGYAVYSLLVPLQEFLSRGVIQGPLFDVLSGSERGRHFWSIVVSNTLFAITHLHLTIAYGAVAFVGGLFWGALYARERTLVLPVVSHVLVGVWALYVLDFAGALKGL